MIEAADGKQALRQALAGRVDLVITDLVMPEQEGIETIQALRRNAPGVGIIAISGAFEGEFLGVAELLGADAALIKPVSAEFLLARVAEVLKAASLRQSPQSPPQIDAVIGFLRVSLVFAMRDSYKPFGCSPKGSGPES